jgi:DNA-binding CsgD family transcriptional regulator
MNVISNPYFLPIAGGAAVAVILFVFLTVIVSLRRKTRCLKAEAMAREEVSDKLNGLGNELDQIRTRMAELEQRRNPLSEQLGEPASVHLNRRGQVLRLYRRGESSAEIASSLGLSQGEIKLIIKIHEMARHEGSAEKSSQQTLIPRRIFDTDIGGHHNRAG